MMRLFCFVSRPAQIISEEEEEEEVHTLDAAERCNNQHVQTLTSTPPRILLCKASDLRKPEMLGGEKTGNLEKIKLN